MILFLDDSPERRKTFQSIAPSAHIVETAIEAIDLLEKYEDWSLVSLDHDLGGRVFDDSRRPDCGMEVVRYIWLTHPRIETIVIHSFNNSAAPVMIDVLRRAEYRVIYKPFDIHFYKSMFWSNL